MFLILLTVSILIFSTFFSLGSVSSVNSTDQNITNQTNVSMATQAQANGISPQVSISLTPTTLDLGTRIADGLDYSYLNRTQINVTGSDWDILVVNENLNLYVRSEGPFVNGSNNILLNNFRYDGFSNSSLPKTAFTTSNSKVKSWHLYGFLYDSVSDTVYSNYYLTVPLGTSPGTYTTTVYYTAMLE